MLPVQLICCVYGLPFTLKPQLQQLRGMSSVESVQVNWTCDGVSTLAESTGAFGGVVSGKVLVLWRLLSAERFPLASTA